MATTAATDKTNPAPGSDLGTDVACHTVHGYISDKARYLTRLKRIEGQARGIHRAPRADRSPRPG